MFEIRPGQRYPAVLRPALTVVRGVQQVVWTTLDGVETLLGRRDPLTPPRRLMYVGSRQFLLRSDFNAIGAELLQYLIDVGGLKPDDNVLDVGCGVGRMATQLTRYLSPASRYEGFDIVPEGIAWCQANVTPRFPRFRFQRADIFNTHYNPAGRYKPDEYRFPYDDGQFSFVFLTSVATHMLSREVEQYLREIRRVLAPGGRCFITWFLINPDTQRAMDSGKSSLQFRYPVPGGSVVSPATPESAVAFEEPFIRDLYRQCGITLVEPIRYGSWSGRTTDVGYQDVILGTKAA